MQALDYKQGWAWKNGWFWSVVLEQTLESPLTSKEIQPVHPKGNQSWIFIGRTDIEAETPILWLPDTKNWLIWKNPDTGEKLKVGGEGEDREWDGWMASLTQWRWVWVTLGVGDGQGGLACCSPWGRKEPDMTKRQNWTELKDFFASWRTLWTKGKGLACGKFILLLLSKQS